LAKGCPFDILAHLNQLLVEALASLRIYPWLVDLHKADLFTDLLFLLEQLALKLSFFTTSLLTMAAVELLLLFLLKQLALAFSLLPAALVLIGLLSVHPGGLASDSPADGCTCTLSVLHPLAGVFAISLILPVNLFLAADC
jgi:hypothetical protein